MLRNFILLPSSSVYGNKLKYPIKETDSLKPLNTYAKNKKNVKKYYKIFLKKRLI